MAGEQKQLLDVLMVAIGHALADLHTATVARVTKVNADTIDCRPVINRVIDGESIALPEFVDVPVLVAQGGGSYTAYPVAVGDYVLLVFTERCFDRWWNGQDYQPPLELRMHDYSDGVALLGLNPLAGLIPIPTTIKQVGDTVQIGDYAHTGDRTQTGDYTHTGNLIRTGNMTVTGDLTLTGDINVTGNITCSGTIAAGNFSGLAGGAMTATVDINTTADVTAGGVSLNSHTHPESGGGTTGAPN
jgi:hypothetical protein